MKNYAKGPGVETQVKCDMFFVFLFTTLGFRFNFKFSFACSSSSRVFNYTSLMRVAARRQEVSMPTTGNS